MSLNVDAIRRHQAQQMRNIYPLLHPEAPAAPRAQPISRHSDWTEGNIMGFVVYFPCGALFALGALRLLLGHWPV